MTQVARARSCSRKTNAVLVLGLSTHASNMQKPMEEEESIETSWTQLPCSGAGDLQCAEHPPAAQLSVASPLSVPKPTPYLQLSASLLSWLATRSRQVAPITKLSEQTSGLRLIVSELPCQKHSTIYIGVCIAQQQLFKHSPSTTAACFPPSGWQSSHIFCLLIPPDPSFRACKSPMHNLLLALQQQNKYILKTLKQLSC